MNLAQHQLQQEKASQQKYAHSIVNHNLLMNNVKLATQNVMKSNTTVIQAQPKKMVPTQTQIVLQQRDEPDLSNQVDIEVNKEETCSLTDLNSVNTHVDTTDGIDAVQDELRKQIENIVSNQITSEIEKMESSEKHSLLDDIQRKILKETTSFSTQRILEATGGESIQEEMTAGGMPGQSFPMGDEMMYAEMGSEMGTSPNTSKGKQKSP